MLVTQIAKLLHAQGIGVFNETGAGGTIFIGFQPATPDAIITLYPSGGFSSSAKLGYDNPSFKVRVRGTTDIRTADSKAQAIYNALHGLGMLTLPDGTYLLTCTGFPPGSMGIDSNGRHEYSINFQTEISNPNSNREA